jgi:hypothetical protein
MLRSFVRENRMQGSARGRSGNWPFYLDELMKGEKYANGNGRRTV